MATTGSSTDLVIKPVRAIIDAGAVVPRDTQVPPYAIYAGVPAKPRRYRTAP